MGLNEQLQDQLDEKQLAKAKEYGKLTELFAQNLSNVVETRVALVYLYAEFIKGCMKVDKIKL